MPIRHAILAVLALAFTVPAHAEPLKPIRVIMVGDSTMTNKAGYGDGFCAQFKPEVTCFNLARGGRSSKSYRAEGLWDTAVAQIRDNAAYSTTYVWIGFGHNDGSSKPERHTDIKTEFPLNMRAYGDDIAAAAAIPIYVTPLTQRWFKDGKLRADLLPWADAIKQVASEGGYQVVDFYAVSQKAVQEMGLPAANRMAGEPIPQNILDTEATGTSVPAVFSDASQDGKPVKQAFDYTHLGPAGSAYFGKLAVDTWAAQSPEIRPYLK
jgi:lysophospholipase L1-like esterase